MQKRGSRLAAPCCARAPLKQFLLNLNSRVYKLPGQKTIDNRNFSRDGRFFSSIANMPPYSFVAFPRRCCQT